MTHTTTRKNGLVNNETAAVDTGTTNATGAFKFYTGAGPGAGNTEAGTLLATVNAANPSFASASAGAAAANGTPLSATAVASGTIGHCRLVDRDGNVVEELSVGTSGAEINFAGGLSVISGGTITISSFSINGPS